MPRCKLHRKRPENHGTWPGTGVRPQNAHVSPHGFHEAICTQLGGKLGSHKIITVINPSILRLFQFRTAAMRSLLPSLKCTEASRVLESSIVGLAYVGASIPLQAIKSMLIRFFASNLQDKNSKGTPSPLYLSGHNEFFKNSSPDGLSNWNDFTLLSGMTILQPFRVPRSDWIESQGGRRSHKVGQLLKFTAAPHLLVKLPQAPAKTPNLQGMSKVINYFISNKKWAGPGYGLLPYTKKGESNS